MAEFRLPVPRLEALLFCQDGVPDDGGTFVLRGVGDRPVAFGIPPFTIDGYVFVRYAVRQAAHTAELRIIARGSGTIVDRYQASETPLPGSEGVVTTLIPVSIPFQTTGPHALVLLIDGQVIGHARLEIGALPTGIRQ